MCRGLCVCVCVCVCVMMVSNYLRLQQGGVTEHLLPDISEPAVRAAAAAAATMVIVS